MGIYIYIYIDVHTFTATAHAQRYAETYPARSGIDSVPLSQHFQPALDRDRVGLAESAFLAPRYDDDVGLQTRGRRAFPESAR